MANNKAKTEAPVRKNILARILVALICVSLVAACAFTALDFRPAGAGDIIDSSWKTPAAYADKTANLLLMCIELDETRNQSMTQAVMVVSMDYENNTASVLQLPRETYVGSDVVETGKLNALYNWGYADGSYTGVAALAKTINEQLALPIDNYVLTTTKGVEKLVDALGGASVNCPAELEISQGVSLAAGENSLDGATAAKLVCFHPANAKEDEILVPQRTLMASIANKLMAMDDKALYELAKELFPYVECDMTVRQLLDFAKRVKGIKSDGITLLRLPGEYAASYGIYGLEIFSVRKLVACEALNEYMRPYGEKKGAPELSIIEAVNSGAPVDAYALTLGQ